MSLVPSRILVADPIAEDGVGRLRAAGEVDVATGLSPDQLLGCIADYEALVVRSETKVTAKVLESARRLRVVGRAGVGVDNIDIEAATRHGVLVLNAPTGNTIAAAEHAIALMMALARNVAAADHSVQAGRWERGRFVGVELRHRTLGVYGLGKIGFEVARIASQGLQMRVITHDPLVTTERAEQAGAELRTLSEILEESDVLSLHVPLNDVTRGSIGADQLSRMKRGAHLINVARGGIVDEAALAESIRSGHLRGAGIDVFAEEPIDPGNPLIGLPGSVLTPHLGASTQEAQVNVALDVADQIVEFLAGGSPRSAVNAPTVLPEELAQLRPYVELAVKMGSLAAQLGGSRLRRVICGYSGALAEHDTTVLTAEVLRGLFGHFTETRVNMVNAKAVARQHGVEVDERRTTGSSDHAGSILVEVEGAEPLTVMGTQFGGEPHITRIKDLHLDIRPVGTYLVFSQQDRPGVIAEVAGLLAAHDINLGDVIVGRDHPRGRALSFFQLDDPVDAELLAQIEKSANLGSLRLITF
ncbi:MAG: phosphoglycerate dehydrogenase [Candidatus Dormibacteria bacterium]